MREKIAGKFGTSITSLKNTFSHRLNIILTLIFHTERLRRLQLHFYFTSEFHTNQICMWVDLSIAIYNTIRFKSYPSLSALIEVLFIIYWSSLNHARFDESENVANRMWTVSISNRWNCGITASIALLLFVDWQTGLFFNASTWLEARNTSNIDCNYLSILFLYCRALIRFIHIQTKQIK